MKILSNFIFGSFYGLILSFLFSFMFSMYIYSFHDYVRFISNDFLLYILTISPFILTFGLLGVLFSKKQSYRFLTTSSIISFLFITLSVGVIGVILEGYPHMWFILYIIITLPITIAFGFLFTQIFHRLIHLKKYT